MVLGWWSWTERRSEKEARQKGGFCIGDPNVMVSGFVRSEVGLPVEDDVHYFFPLVWQIW